MRRAGRLPLAGWIVVLTIPVFVGTWIMAPQETLSGTVDRGAIDLPARGSVDTAPITQIAPPPFPPGPSAPSTIYGVERAGLVALTFDDGPHPVHTRRLLEILERHAATATFFVNGYWFDDARRTSAKQLQQLLQQAHAAGHTIGNHTYSHAKLSRIAEDEQRREILTNHMMITAVTGVRPTLFRPPYAVMTDHALELVHELGYTVARWSATAPDEEIEDPEQLQRTVMSWLRAYNGGIVMLHDRHRGSVDAAELILRSLDRDNCRRLHHGRPTFQVVSLDSFLRPPPQSGALRARVEWQRHIQRLQRICTTR